jgi:hypothetical protein
MAGRLVGVAEIAEALGVSRQRADQLTRTRGFPDAVEKVAPLDWLTVERIQAIFTAGRRSITFEQALDALEGGAHTLPTHPRLWRFEEVERWAESDGRQVNDLES